MIELPDSEGNLTFRQHRVQLDKRVGKDLDLYVDGPARSRIAEARNNLKLWLLVLRFIARGTFDKASQNTVERMFGFAELEKLKTFLRSLSRSETRALVDKRAGEAREDLKRLIPHSFEEVVLEIERDIAGI